MAGKLQTQISFDRRRGRIDATAYQDDRLVAVVRTSASTHGRRRVMRVDEAQGQHEALEALVREVGEVSCRTDGTPVGSDPLRPEAEEQIWRRLQSRCLGPVPASVAKSFDLAPGRCATWVVPCRVPLLGSHRRK